MIKTQIHILYIEQERFNKIYPYEKFLQIILQNNIGNINKEIGYLICTTNINIQSRSNEEHTLNLFFELCRMKNYSQLLISTNSNENV